MSAASRPAAWRRCFGAKALNGHYHGGPGHGGKPSPASNALILGPAAGLTPSTRNMWNGPRCKVLFSRFHHMGTVRSYVRPTCAVMTAGLDEVRETGGWIKGARFVRVTGFGLSCFGISSRGSSSVMHPTCRRLPGSSSRRSCAYTAADPTSIPIGSR